MNLRDIVLNYLTDNEKGMQQLITWFLNDVMNEEVAWELDVKVTEFMERTIDSHIPYLYVYASYFKVKDGVNYVSKALLVVVWRKK